MKPSQATLSDISRLNLLAKRTYVEVVAYELWGNTICSDCLHNAKHDHNTQTNFAAFVGFGAMPRNIRYVFVPTPNGAMWAFFCKTCRPKFVTWDGKINRDVLPKYKKCKKSS